MQQQDEATPGALVAWAQETMRLEAEAIATAAGRLDASFAAAAQDVLRCSGKVVITGLGKSGHVARKIAATLASTGTASFFVHPAEALHGDLGMLAKGDVLVAIAFGGETREVVEVAKYARRHEIPIVAISGNRQSSLARLAQHFLDGSVSREACPLNLAPTTSSTLALALGDALAVAVMKARGFAATDFARLHPEGSLGRKLSLVEDYMRALAPEMLLVPTDSFHRVLEVVTRQNFGIAPVVDAAGQLLGVVTDGDVRRAVLRHEAAIFQQTARELMNPAPKVITVGALTLEAVQRMENHRITALVVVSGEGKGKPLGLIRMHDLLAAKVI